MKVARPKIQQSRIGKGILSLIMTAGFTGPSFAQQFDAPYYAYQTRNQAKWESADKQIDKKLAALESKFGKKPNIIYILTDDIGWGELGWQGGGKHRGTPTPTLDKLAYAGMRFWSAYAEPSCTPTRIAINTGRHPVRTGLLSVLWPGQDDGLPPAEITIAELLSGAGYNTAMWGKWHMGDLPKHCPTAQGYDYGYYGLFNGAPDAWQDSHELYETPQPVKAAFYDFPGYDQYEEMTGINLSVAGYMAEKGKERKPISGKAGKLGFGRQEAFENESNKQMVRYIEKHAKSDKPFFIYWASYALQITGSQEHQNDPDVDKQNAQASMMVLHNKHVDNVIRTLEDEGVAENTLVVWWSDNGPMYAFYPTSGYTLLRGAKGDVLEGGVRVPGMAYWPGMIEPNQDPQDIIHVTDLFTTAARLAGATDKIPSDRVTDGIDQTALFLLGEGNGRRNYMMHYSGSELGAIRFEDFKVHIKPGHGGLPGMDFYNVKRDPGEKYGQLYPGLFAVAPIQKFIGSHMKMNQQFPHRDPAEAKGNH